MTNPTDSQGLEGEDELDKIIDNLAVTSAMVGHRHQRTQAQKRRLKAELTKAKEQAREEVLDELEKELPLSERLAWSDEDGSYMDVRVFNNNINGWIQAHRQSKRTPTEKDKT